MTTPMESSRPMPSEALSALADGELDAQQSADTVRQLLDDADALQQWHAYQIIGDVLRDPKLSPTPRELDFSLRLQKLIAQEDTPAQPGAADLLQPMSPAVVVPTVAAANADVFRWKMLAGVATLGLGVVLAFGLRGNLKDDTVANLAGNTPPPTATAIAEAAADPVMLRDPALDALLQAHQQMGGHSALQMPNGFLRNATFERAGQ